MKKVLVVTVFLVLCPGLACADTALSTENLSSIISFFAGNLAMMGFIAGFMGGRL